MNGSAPTAPRFEAEALADMAGLAARHPSIFRVNWPRRALTVAIVAVLAGLFISGFWALGFSFARIAGGLGKLVEFAGFMLPPSPGSYATFLTYLMALAQPLAIALLCSLSAAIRALPSGVLEAKNVIPNVFLHFSLRRGLDVVRGVDVLIWALIWINVVGLGPFAGILAVATSNFGEFGKLFSEAIEAMDKKAVEGVASTGGGKLHQVRFGLLPQVFPVIVSQVLYYFESNTRSATIIGVVGAGGVGLHLYEQIRMLEWQHVSFLVLMILLTVAVIDFVSGRLRFAIIGNAKIVA